VARWFLSHEGRYVLNRKVVLATVALACGVAIGIPSVQAANQVLFASNAGKVNGIAAARAPKANTLLPLNNQAQLPASVLPNVTKLKGGQTITGVIGGGFKATAARDIGSATASFPIKAPKAIAREAVGMAQTSSESPYCTGDVGAPTAPQGILCIYPANEQFVNVRQDCTPGPFPNCTSGEGVFVVNWVPIFGAQNGFGVTWESIGAGTSQFYATWAYTAPVKGLEPGEGAAAGGGDDSNDA
jgi:hypothetical protein